jgi:hypothetical protein
MIANQPFSFFAFQYGQWKIGLSECFRPAVDSYVVDVKDGFWLSLILLKRCVVICISWFVEPRALFHFGCVRTDTSGCLLFDTLSNAHDIDVTTKRN